MSGSEEEKALPSRRRSKSDVGMFRRQRAFCRKRGVQFLYSLDVCDDWMIQPDAISNFKQMLDDLDEDTETLPVEQREKAYPYMEELILGVREYLDEIDGLIRAAAQNWRLERMSPVDRCILRLAVYEMKHVPRVTAATAINEAVELSKSFGQGETPRFVNGVLEKIRKMLEEPASVVETQAKTAEVAESPAEAVAAQADAASESPAEAVESVAESLAESVDVSTEATGESTGSEA